MHRLEGVGNGVGSEDSGLEGGRGRYSSYASVVIKESLNCEK